MPPDLGRPAILPAIDDANRAWFTSGELRIQACEDCGLLQHPPEDVCRGCQGTRLHFQPCGGAGRIESVAIVHHPVHPALADRVPYAVVVVSLTDAPGVHAVGNVLGCEPGEVEIGQRVRAVFQTVEDPDGGPPLQVPQWELLEPTDPGA